MAGDPRPTAATAGTSSPTRRSLSSSPSWPCEHVELIDYSGDGLCECVVCGARNYYRLDRGWFRW